MARCSICQTLIQDDDATQRCGSCESDYHQACWEEIGGCATYGCPEAPEAEKAPPPPPTGGLGWGDEKTCPRCRATIASSLLLCRCGARFPYADPMSPRDYEEYLERERLQRSTRLILVALFVLTALGFVAPVTGPAAAWLAWSRRDVLSGQAGAYTALAAGTALMGLVYLLIFVLVAAGL